MSDDAVSTDVLVIGAGPTGLMLANWLARSGIRTMIVDGKTGPTTESRAVVLQARTMEILDQLGAVERFEALSQTVRRLAPGYERRRFGVLPVGALGTGLTPFPRLTVLEQSKTEQLLDDHMRSLGGEVRWNTRLTAIGDASHTGAGVRVSLEGPTGALEVQARYCVGADGSGSVLRRLLGIPFEGITNEQIFYVCDAEDVVGLVRDAVNVRFGERDFILTFPMPGTGRHRLIGTVPRADVEGDLIESAVRPRLARIHGVSWGASRWFSTYQVHHRVAQRFRSGGYFLAGDAAHVHSPVGAQGMNTGLQDAHDLAMKLVDVIRDGASDSLLDRYEAERRPVALRLISTTDRLFGLAISTRPLARMLRRWAAPVIGPIALLVLPRVGVSRRLFGYLSQTRIHYWMGDSEKERAGGRRDPVVGRRLRYTGTNFDVLRSAGWQVHSYGAIDPADARCLRRELGLAVHTFPRAARTALRQRTFYLVRPDGFVAAKAAPADAVSAFRLFLPHALADARGVR